MKKSRYLLSQIADGLLLGAVLLGVALFILYPICSVVATSFFSGGVFTLDHYRDILSRGNLKLIQNSLWVAALSSALTTALAFCIALFAFASGSRVRTFVQNSLLLTMISPSFVSALAFITLFGRRGLITYGLLGLSLNPYGWQGIVILQTVSNVSFAALLLLTAFDTLDVRQIMASRDLGAGPSGTLLHVILPSVRSGILSVLFILFTMSLADFGTPIVIGGRYKVLATEAYLQVISTPNLGKASAISVLMVPSAVVAFYFYRKSLGKTGVTASSSVRSLSSSGYQLRFSRPIRALLFGATALFFVVMALKYGTILLSAVSNTSSGSIRFTLKYIEDLPRSQWSSFWRSIRYSAAAGAAASLLGILLSYYTHRRGLPGMKAVEFCASLPYIIPGTFFGLGYVAAFTHGPIALRGTAAIIIFNYVFRQVSVASKAANAAFTAIEEKQESAARDLGAGHAHIFFGILLPQLLPTFLTCFITVFTSSMTAVGAIVFLISPGKTMASTELFSSISNGRYGAGAVQAVCIIGVTMAVNLMAMSLLNHYHRVQKGEKGHVPTTPRP